jgi:anaerobic selenocysteine-containing dehydrogenase
MRDAVHVIAISDRTPQPDEGICPYCGVGCGIKYNPESEKATGWKGPSTHGVRSARRERRRGKSSNTAIG